MLAGGVLFSEPTVWDGDSRVAGKGFSFISPPVLSPPCGMVTC